MIHRILSNKIKNLIENRLLVVFFLSFASGFPLALIASVLSTRLSEAGITISSIGLFVLARMPYSFKFLWAPFMDGMKLPIFYLWLGRRRSWLFVSQVLLILFIGVMCMHDPQNHITMCGLLALGIGFLSATQDVAVDAYRIELLSEKNQSLGATIANYGYRVGLFVAGAGSLAVAQYVSWTAAYLVAAGLMGIGLLTTLFSSEPAEIAGTRGKTAVEERPSMISLFVNPLKDLLRIKNIYYVLAFVMLFQIGDTMAGVLTYPFLKYKGFTNIEIVAVVKTFGLVATLVGVALGGIIAYRLPLVQALLVAGVLQMLSNLLFVYQDHVGHDNLALLLTIAGENLAGGIGGCVMVTYLSTVCRREFVATQYALLASLTAVARNVLSGFSGFAVEQFGWSIFFLGTAAIAIPALCLLPYIKASTDTRQN